MPGQYALRGGILDVYPPEAQRPVRVELIGDTVESLREFDPESQRSTGPGVLDESDPRGALVHLAQRIGDFVFAAQVG